ncbi:hypothetical protein BdWA1_002704 [Babesia duncani]|uniref:Uncharacterized protein n=1 Tax=Babesia duncani TaxID=323732 RepID=A0AAD9UNN5_9APIC|nr:hypothetical protein BdWA1_002704 [Babesia duncani]
MAANNIPLSLYLFTLIPPRLTYIMTILTRRIISRLWYCLFIKPPNSFTITLVPTINFMSAMRMTMYAFTRIQVALLIVVHVNTL